VYKTLASRDHLHHCELEKVQKHHCVGKEFSGARDKKRKENENI